MVIRGKRRSYEEDKGLLLCFPALEQGVGESKVNCGRRGQLANNVALVSVSVN